MDWTDEGIVLSARKHGEGAAIVSLFTATHGRHAGLVRGGAGRRARGLYEAGNRLRATWRARLEDHLGSYTCELEAAHAAAYLGDPLRLAGLSALSALVEAALPERENHGELYAAYRNLIERGAGGADLLDWLAGYVRFEAALLTELGFGLDLDACAATGLTDDLIYVSPKSGAAVSREAGQPYKDKLLTLPGFLRQGTPPTMADLVQGLELTGYFLARNVFINRREGEPAARGRLMDKLSVRRPAAAGENVI